ncbi:enoyl-CoA hydratase/isomerase family protein [Inmirania thermothiophila]|uniref:Methylglutaconyl-CoA hydratase n=1 Tax=Inmirania thermothiophila TaxID=1750597 RepID=A0A3N1Y0U2_9GAMM|nr:enoyl-CoA hydratase/isomerase family protein [Inmirania thermothiophila]ROR32436.1 methylglutaconyl-CoA hydratase [Inmirania thermothiophila]
MSSEPVRTEIDDEGFATVTLNRPELHNAFDDELIARLAGIFRGLAENPRVRVVLLAAEGRSFSAGADLNWMRRMAGYSEAENVEDAMGLARMLETLYRLPRPTIALVHGATFGGGVGLVACCDIALAAPEARFALTEVRLGILPAVISPYVVQAMGMRAARRYILTAERFDAEEARRLGLVHEVVPAEGLRARGLELARQLAGNGPEALAEAKALVDAVAHRPVDEALMRRTAEWIARVRASAEGREGIGAFLEKREPAWRRRPDG